MINGKEDNERKILINLNDERKKSENKNTLNKNLIYYLYSIR